MNTASGAVKKFGTDAAADLYGATSKIKELGTTAASAGAQASQGLMSISTAGLNMTMRLNPAMLAAGAAIMAVGMAAITVGGMLKDALVQGFTASLQEAIKFEAAFAQVRKVIPDVASSVNQLREGLLAMSTTIPMSAEGLASISAIGGQMGIDSTPALLKFTDTVARLAVTAEMSSDNVASALGRIGEVVDPEGWQGNIDKMGSSLVFVADQSNASAAEIVNMSRRLAGAGAAAGMTAPQIFGIASALASVGVRAEAGGGSMSSFIAKMSQAVSEGGAKLEAFARVAGVTSSQFASMFKADAAGALVQFTEGLSRIKNDGQDLNVVLKELGVTEIRQRQSMLGLAQAGDELRRNISNANQGYEENTALMIKSGMIFDTTAAKITMFEQGLARMGKRIGDAFLPMGKNVLDIFINAFDQIDAFMKEKGPEIAASFAPLAEMITTLTAGVVASGPELLGVLGGISEWLIGIDITNLKGMVDELRFFLEGMRMVSPELDKIMKRGEEYRKNLAIQKQYKAADVMLGSQIGRDLGLAPTAAPLLPGTDAGNAGFPFRRGVLPSEAQAMGNFDMGGVPWEGGEEWEAASAATEKFNKELTDTQAELSQLRAEGTGAFAGIEAGIQGALAKEIEHAKTLGLSSTQLATLIGQYKAVAAAKLEAAKITELRSQRGYVAGDAQKEATALSATVGTGLGQAEIRGVTDMVEIGKKLDELRTKALANGDTFSVPANLKESLDYYTDVVKGTEQAIEASNRWQKSLEELGPTIRTIGIDFEKIIAPLDKLGSKAGNDQIANAFNALAEQRDKVDITAPGGEQMYADITGKMTEYYDVLASRGKSALQLIGVGTEQAKKSTMDWKTGLAGVNDLMQALGVKAGSLPAILMSVTSGIGGMLSTLKASVDKGGFGGAGGFLSGLMGKGIKGDGKNVLEGMLGSLGFAGQAFAIGTSLFKGLKGLFSEPSWKKVGREAGGVLGTEIGEEMAKKIEEKAKKLGISVKNAALLSLPEAMSGSGKDARTFGTQALGLLEAIKSGAVPAAEGMKALGESFDQIKDSAMKAGDVGSNAMVALIKNAREAGKMTEEMKSFVREQIDLSIGGVNKAFGTTQNIDGKDQFVGLEATTQVGAEAQATIFATTFWAAVKEKGVIGAADAMKSTFDSMKKRMEESGFDVSKIFAPIEALMNFSQDPKFRGAAEGANGLNEALKGLANSGYMTRDAFSAFGVGANDAFQQALAATGDQRLALEAIAPLLGSLKTAAANYGVELDGPTQELIKAAEEQGIVFPEEPLQRIADILESIAKVLGAEIPAAAARAGAAIGNIPSPEGFRDFGGGPESPGFGSGGTLGTPPPDVTAASGFGPVLLRNDTVIQAHEGEMAMIIPKDQSRKMRYRSAARGLADIRNDGGDGGGGGGGGLPDPGSLGGGGGDGGGSGTAPDVGGGGGGVSPEVIEQQTQQIAMLTEVIGRLAEREQQQVVVNSRPEIKIDENPLRSREAAAELRRITVDEVEKAIRLGQGSLVETLKQALNL
jgi:TP901 family phage tail tape measure protein